jgi:hypothetical protein
MAAMHGHRIFAFPAMHGHRIFAFPALNTAVYVSGMTQKQPSSYLLANVILVTTRVILEGLDALLLTCYLYVVDFTFLAKADPE